MIARNEERELARCLDSVRDLAGQLIVVDTGSTDRTAEIAAGYGAEVVPFDFTFVDFAAARNCAIARARGEWILMLDADETLAPEGAPAIANVAAEGCNAGYFLERVNRSAESVKAFTDYVVRLFPRRPGIRYRGRVHETVDASILAQGGKLVQTAIRIDHRFRSDPETRRRKNLWYIQVLKEEIAADPADDSRLDFLAAEYHQLEMFDEAAAIAEQIARVRPNDARAHLFAGVYHLLYRPDFPRARADFERALELRPGYPEAESFLKLLAEKAKG
ncbi:MAG TPA: glycosyltransferase family 2 protein [Bryobacteraceae bacterium]|nr:glycosyltransferase family 2 protein [Bryobacteraceae bacterium]